MKSMSQNPINLAVRFILEIAALASLAYWGWTQHTGFLRYLLAIGLPLLASVLWGTLAVPGDPSRSGKAPVPVPGIIRLVLELVLFGSAAWCLAESGQAFWANIFSLVVLVHYAVSYDRVLWLLKK